MAMLAAIRPDIKEIEMVDFLRAGMALVAVVAAATVSAPLAGGQDKYPSRPVKVVMPLPAGQSADVRARIIADQLSKIWGQQVVVENRPGGGLLVGVQAALSAPADGYTLLAAPASVYTILPVQRDKPPVDVNRDLVPVGMMSHEGFLIAVSSKLGVSTLGELIALANREPGKIVIGTSGAGTGPNLVARRLADLAKAPFTVLPYATGGTSAAIADIVGGRVHAVIDTLAGLKGTLDSGDLKAVAIMSSERAANAPDLPTAAETVLGLTGVGWIALVAPRGTPDGIVQQLSGDLRKALEAPEARTRLEQTGRLVRPMSPVEAMRFIEAEQALWWPFVKATAAAK
jgi:tripartite-type tricarboxylate transporter receptor subunit TctC